MDTGDSTNTVDSDETRDDINVYVYWLLYYDKADIFGVSILFLAETDAGESKERASNYEESSEEEN
eukprot:11035732-Ditylum_brightwellii.AAC.1